jgi:hypothetical protein
VDRIWGGGEEGDHQRCLSTVEGIGCGGRRSASQSGGRRWGQNGRGGSTWWHEARGGVKGVGGEPERPIHSGSVTVSRVVVGVGAKVVREEEGKRGTLRSAMRSSYSHKSWWEPAASWQELRVKAAAVVVEVWCGRGLSAVVQTVGLTGEPHTV